MGNITRMYEEKGVMLDMSDNFTISRGDMLQLETFKREYHKRLSTITNVEEYETNKKEIKDLKATGNKVIKAIGEARKEKKKMLLINHDKFHDFEKDLANYFADELEHINKLEGEIEDQFLADRMTIIKEIFEDINYIDDLAFEVIINLIDDGYTYKKSYSMGQITTEVERVLNNVMTIINMLKLDPHYSHGYIIGLVNDYKGDSVAINSRVELDRQQRELDKARAEIIEETPEIVEINPTSKTSTSGPASKKVTIQIDEKDYPAFKNAMTDKAIRFDLI